MLKRIVPVISAVVLVLCIFALPLSVSAASTTDILNYKNFVYSSNTDSLGDTWEYFRFPKEYCGVITNDSNGNVSRGPGVMRGTMYQDLTQSERFAMSAYWPGGYTSGAYLDATNLGSGTSVRVDCKFSFSDLGQEAWLKIQSDFCVQYFDENLNFIGYQYSPTTSWEIDGTEVDGLIYESLTLYKPVGTAYLIFYSTFSFSVMNRNVDEVYVDFEIGDAWFEARTIFDSWNDAFIPEFGGFPDDIILWLRDVADAFLDLEIAPDLSINKVMHLILVVGVLFWFIKLIS